MCVCVFELGTWGLAPGADTVNMAEAIHEQPLCHCHPESWGNRPAKSPILTGEERREGERRDKGSRLWQNALDPFIFTGTALPRINALL